MFPTMTYISFFFFFLLIITTFFPTQSHSQQLQDYYTSCKHVDQSYNCGNLSNILYPFWGQNRPYHCGAGNPFYLECHNNQNTTILLSSQNFTVLEINTTNHIMKLKRTDLSQNLCSPQFDDTFLSPNIFQYLQGTYFLDIYYNCTYNVTQDVPKKSLCGSHNPSFIGNYVDVKQKPPKRCEKNTVPVGTDFPIHMDYFDHDGLERGLEKGFEVVYSVTEQCSNCLGDGLVDCSSGFIDKYVESCYYDNCPDGSIALSTNCSPLHNNSSTTIAGKQLSWKGKLKIILGVASAAMVALLMCIIIYCYRGKSLIQQGKFWFRTKNDKNIEAFLKDHGALLQKRYKFSEIKRMTNSFKVKLGQGGFGVVYKGKLFDGSSVAIKILNASKGNGEEFINEVASITRTSHVNIVTLLGFCFEGNKKALIYEFMSNGSLDKFLYNKGPETIASLSWDNLYQIAKGIARGLEYLHRGCNTQILHFDIKPHNILLDENLCPKISDFGLAKLCLKKESTVFMSNARGTVGYLAPEVWYRQFGGVSQKSDVYSYGMMLLEMVGVRNNIDVKTNQTSEYFPDWIYKKLEMDSVLRTDIMMAIEENEIAKGMTIVGLWCIQTLPNDRPTMSRVIEMLEGSMNVLEIPPKPFFSSPTRSLSQSSTSLNLKL